MKQYVAIVIVNKMGKFFSNSYEQYEYIQGISSQLERHLRNDGRFFSDSNGEIFLAYLK